jgi:hypothetical protein
MSLPRSLAAAVFVIATATAALAQLPNCPAGDWSESKAGSNVQNGNFRWTIGIHDDTLFVRRTDGIVSGGFHKVAANKWVGSLDWNGAGVWDRVELYVDSCSLIRTNQAWWFIRDPTQQVTPQPTAPPSF